MWEKMWRALPFYDSASRGGAGGREVQSDIEGLLTEYEPEIRETAGGGFVHPGIGLTKGLLENVRAQVRRGAEPWRTYFADMLQSGAASGDPEIGLKDPENTDFDSQETNGLFIRDALTVYTQGILYIVTGDSRYRSNGLRILRAWSGMRPEGFDYFTDACIHVGVPMNRMCMGAELLRCSGWRAASREGDSDLEWTEGEISAFRRNLLEPAVKTFLSSCDEFMNQHLYTVMGAMSAYLFLDDREGYERTVEWFTVNKHGRNPGFNGSLKRLFREITTMDEDGEEEGSGPPLPGPMIQHMEMGRDQAHGCGDLTNAVIIARLLLAQGTRVDPAQGTASEAADAVGIYEFLDDRILKAADFFFQYLLGYDRDWVQAPYSIREGRIAGSYHGISPNYRGRYNTANCWDLYLYYACRRPEVNLEEEYPFFYEAFMRKLPSNYYTGGRREINWENRDGGGDFWLFIPPCMAGDGRLLARPQRDYRIEPEDRGVMVENREAMSVGTEGDMGYVRFARSLRASRLAITTGGVGGRTIALRVRTDGLARLSLENGVKGDIFLPDTEGNWVYVTYTRREEEVFGDLYYLAVSDIQGSYVDLDAIDIKPDEEREERKRIDILSFEDGNEDVFCVSCQGMPLKLHFRASCGGGRRVVYEAAGLPEGAALDRESGILEWNPGRAGRYSFYVCVGAGQTRIVKRVEIYVERDRRAAVRRVCVHGEKGDYTGETWRPYEEALREALEAVGAVSEGEFSARLKRLVSAWGALRLLSPRLERDPLTDGTSLDYPGLVHASTMGREIHYLTDGTGTFCGYYKAAEGAHVMDFGPDYQIGAVKFGYQARYGFPDRLAGVQVFGSNDGREWRRLTVGEAACTQAYQEVAVSEEERGNRYRYLKICKTAEYPDILRGEISGLLELGELRIFGSRYEKSRKGDARQ